jgi:methylase of polypeptide subunit release factors
VSFGKLYKRILDVLRQSPPLTFGIFGIRIHSKIHRFTWDVTTLVLKKAIDRHIPDGNHDVLEMGCGHVALLAQYVKRIRPGSRVTGVDIYDEFVRNAAENARRNGLSVEILQGDLYQGLDRRFDFILFNPPYVPFRQTDNPYPLTTFSGKDGTDTTRRFLTESHDHLNKDGRILLGVNCFHVPEQRVMELAGQYGYVVRTRVRRSFNTARVFILEDLTLLKSPRPR